MHNIIRTACIYAIIGIYPACAADYIYKHVPQAKIVGQGRVQIFLWDVYDAKLYAPEGVYNDGKPFALELRYFQKLQGKYIADYAVSEMRKLGYKNEIKLADWHGRMSRIFPDVTPGSMVTGIYDPAGPTIFYEGGVQIGSIEDPAFGKEFFRIWLDARTSIPDLRQGLLNLDIKKNGNKNEIPSGNYDFGDSHAF